MAHAHRFDKLTQVQKEIAAVLVENDLKPKKERRTYQEIADEFGITRMTLHRYKAQTPLFVEYKQHLTTLYLQDKQTELVRVLIDNLDKGNPSTKMMDLMAKMTPNAIASTKQELEVSQSETSQEDVLARIKELEEAKKQAEMK